MFGLRMVEQCLGVGLPGVRRVVSEEAQPGCQAPEHAVDGESNVLHASR